jgi:hypothetical protein
MTRPRDILFAVAAYLGTIAFAFLLLCLLFAFLRQ